MRNYEGMKLPPTIDRHVRNELLKADKWMKQASIVLSKVVVGGTNYPSVVIRTGTSGNFPDHTHARTGEGGNTLGDSFSTMYANGQWLFNGATYPQATFGATGVGATDVRQLRFYGDSIGPGYTNIMFMDIGAALGGPVNTADYKGCPGARLYLWKDPAGTYDAVYGQSFVDNWVMPGPEDITYSIFSGGTPPFTAFLRAQWAGNGDYTNYGAVTVRKSPGAAGPTTPLFIGLETTSGSNILKLLAPANLTGGSKTQQYLNYNGNIPVIGDDPPSVAAGAMGKVDLAAQSADIASTNLTNGALVGLYILHYYYDCSVQDAGAGSVAATFTWNDEFGARTITAAGCNLASTANRTQGSVVMYVGSGNIAYSTGTGGVGYGATPAKYGIRIRLVYLG